MAARAAEPLYIFFAAVDDGNFDEVERLAEEEYPINDSDEEGRTAMHRAAEKGNMQMIEVLLDLQLSDEARDKEGLTAMHVAAMHGHAMIVELLIDIGGMVDTKSGRSTKAWTPLMFAASRGHLDVIGALLHTDSDLLEAKDADGHMAVDIAWQNNHTEAAETLEMAAEARRVRTKKEREAAALKRRAHLKRADTKRLLRQRSSFRLDDALQASSEDKHGDTHVTPLMKLHRGFRKVTSAAGTLAAMRKGVAAGAARLSRSSSSRRLTNSSPTREQQHPAERKGKAISWKANNGDVAVQIT